MMMILITAGFFISLCVFALGMWLLLRSITGAPARLGVEGPVGFVLVVAGAASVYFLSSFYAPRVEAENGRLNSENTQLKKDLEDTKHQRDGFDAALRGEKGRTDGLAADLRVLKAEKEQVERDLSMTRDGLSRTRNELAQTQAQLSTESSRANSVTKQLADETGQRREAQRQARVAWLTADLLGLNDRQRAEFNNIQKGVLALNESLSALRISEAHWPRLEGKKAVATFEIYQKAFEADLMRPRGAGLFVFESEKYSLKGDHRGRIAEEMRTKIASLICEAARRAIAENVPLPDAVRNMPPIKEYDLDPELLSQLAELQYLQMRIKLLAGNATVLVRGYADGERGSGERKLDPPSRAIVKLHENTKRTPDEYTLNFRPELTSIQIGRPKAKSPTYTNSDLPNLRGAEAASIINALVGSCSAPTAGPPAGTVTAEVLEGQVSPDHSEIDRKARVHLLVFLKEP